MQLRHSSKKRGFTLVELLVSVGLFSVVLTVTLGSIITIADSNKKARSLMSVMNNLNFAVDSITRSFKSGRINPGFDPAAGGECVSLEEIDYNTIGYAGEGFDTRTVEYCFVDNLVTQKGILTKEILAPLAVATDAVPLTSPDVDVDHVRFDVRGYDSGQQPLLHITIEGTVKISEKINSKFLIQTSVSQRQLNI